MVEALKLNCGKATVPGHTQMLQSQQDPKAGLSEGSQLNWGKQLIFFFLHFATSNLAIVRGGPSSTPRHAKFLKGVALEEERAENKVWEKKSSLAEGCHHSHLSYPKRSQNENSLFSWCHHQVVFQTHFHLVSFMLEGQDQIHLHKKSVLRNPLLKYHQLMISRP